MNHAFPVKQKKSGGKMHQKWKEMTGEFSKKSKTNTEKRTRNMENLRRFLEKLQRFSRNLRRFFWNVGDIIPIRKE